MDGNKKRIQDQLEFARGIVLPIGTKCANAASINQILPHSYNVLVCTDEPGIQAADQLRSDLSRNLCLSEFSADILQIWLTSL